MGYDGRAVKAPLPECPYDPVAGPEVRAFPPTALRGYREFPVFHSPLHGGFWVATDYRTVRQVLRDATSFCQSPNGSVPRVPYTRPRVPNSIDDPEHRTWRKLLLPLFAPRWSDALEPMLRATARETLDLLAPAGSCEALGQYAFALPAARFCAQLGLPVERQAEFLHLGNELIYGTVRVRAEHGDAAAASHRARCSDRIDDELGELVARRRTTPGDDIVSALLGAERDGSPLTDDEILNVVSFLFFAGIDSTATAIGFALLHLAQHPDDRRALTRRPELWPTAVDELLRVGAVHHLGRLTGAAVELAGVTIPAGELVLAPTAAANRDPAVFDAPDDVRLDRSPNHHLTFGVGPHHCLGAGQARLEMAIALQEFLARIPEFELDPDVAVTYVSSGGKSRPSAVPLRYPPSDGPVAGRR